MLSGVGWGVSPKLPPIILSSDQRILIPLRSLFQLPPIQALLLPNARGLRKRLAPPACRIVASAAPCCAVAHYCTPINMPVAITVRHHYPCAVARRGDSTTARLTEVVSVRTERPLIAARPH